MGAAVLDGLLGEYVEGIDQRQLELDVLNGHLLLQNLTVRSSALQKLQLPLNVKAGVVGRVELRIPWAHLSTQPTELRLNNLLLLVGPQSEVPWDHEAEERRVLEHKLAALIAHDRKSAAVALAERERPKRMSWAARLSARVIEKLQVDVTNVVVRYVDGTHGPIPYSITLGIKSIKLRSQERAPAGSSAASSANGAAPADKTRMEYVIRKKG